MARARSPEGKSDAPRDSRENRETREMRESRERDDPAPAAEPDDVKYGAAVDEIEQILASIDRDEVDLDELGQKVERAVELLKICRAKLKATEARVTDVLKDLAAEEAASEADEEEADDATSASIAEESDEDETNAPTGESKPSRGRKKSTDDDEELPF